MSFLDECTKLKIIKHNKGLQKIAEVNLTHYRIFSGKYIIQEANIGLIKAVDEYNLTNDNRIITYANWKMLDSIQRLTEKNVKTSNEEYHFNEEKNSTNDEDNYDDIEYESNVDESENDFEFLNNADNTEENIAKKQELVNQLMTELTEREFDMVSMYYGINNIPRQNLEKIGEKHKLTKERVRQIIEKGKRKMRIKALVENKTYQD